MKKFQPFKVLLCATLLVASTSLARSQTTETYGIAADGAILQWNVYAPTTPEPWPTVLVIHGGGFQGGTRADAGLIPVAKDLASAGYLALSIEYRLAPPGSIAGQTSTGQKMEQYEDVQMAVRAARADTRGNGKVAAVGGSAGGTHATWIALTSDLASRVDVAVSLSGAYDLSDFSSDPNINQFSAYATNFTGVSNPPTSEQTATLQLHSPVYNVDATVAPLLMVNSIYDSMPFVQLADMTNALRALGVANFQTLTVPGSGHSWENWTAAKSEAMFFIAVGFANAGVTQPPPAVAPTITQQPVKKSVRVGAVAKFSVVASGDAPLVYQWLKNGSAINGATSASYTTPPTTTADNGARFSVIVSNSAGGVTSTAARLTVR